MNKFSLIRHPLSKVALLIGSALASQTAQAGPTYMARALDLPVGQTCYLNDLNNRGQVVGACMSADRASYAAFATAAKGKRTSPVGTLSGTMSWVNGVNNAGVLVGDATVDGDMSSHAWMKAPGGEMIDLGTLGGNDSAASDVNDKGLIVGVSTVDDTGSQAGFVILPGSTQMQAVPTLGGTYARVAAVNNRGVIAGTSMLAGDVDTRGFYSRAPYRKLVMLDSLGGQITEIADINDSGTMVGFATPPNSKLRRAVTAQVGSKALIELATPAGRNARANGINSAGLIVGTHLHATENRAVAFSCTGNCSTDLTDLNSVVTDLPAGVTLVSAQRVNDKGMISAQGSDGRLYLLLPQVQ